MVGVTYNVSAVPAEVVDAKTSVEESPDAVPVVVWHALHLQRTTSEHFDIDRSRTSIEVLSGTSGRAERVLRWCVSLPPACVHDYGRSSASAAFHYDARCWCIRMSQCVHPYAATTYGRGCLLPTPRLDTVSPASTYRTRLRDASDWLLTEQAHGGVRQV